MVSEIADDVSEDGDVTPEDDTVANVKDFGALGDGVQDDSAAIQLALSSGKSNIYFPSGTYLIGSSLVPYGDQALYGAGSRISATLRAAAGVTIVKPNVDDSADSKQHITFSNLRFAGKMEHALEMYKCTNFLVQNCRFVADSGYPTGDFIRAGSCWDSIINGMSVWTGQQTEGAAIHFGGAMHGVTVRDLHTSSKLKYGVRNSANIIGTSAEKSANQHYSGNVLQGHAYGYSFENNRGVTINNTYFEATRTLVRLGENANSLATSNNSTTGVVINGMRESSLDTSLWGSNDTAAIELLNCKGVVINGWKSDEVDDSNFKAIMIGSAQNVQVNGCVLKTSADSLSDSIVTTGDEADNSTLWIRGDTGTGYGELVPATYDAGQPNRHFTIAYPAGVHTPTTWSPTAGYRNPDYAYSLNRYLVPNGYKQAVIRLAMVTAGTEADFYLDSGALKEVETDATVTAWLDGDTARVKRIYDQTDPTLATYISDAGADPVGLSESDTALNNKNSLLFTNDTDVEMVFPGGQHRAYSTTMFVVAAIDGTTTNDEYLLGADNGGDQFRIEAGNGANSWGAGIGVNPVTSTAALADEPSCVIDIWVDDTDNGGGSYDWSVKYNNGDEQTGTTTDTRTDDVSSPTLGTTGGGSTYFAFGGSVAEIFGYGTPLKTATRTAISTAVMAEYSIP